MPLNNYFNPTAVQPKQGYAPTGFMGGMQYDQDRQMFEQAMFLQKLLTMDSLDRQQMETEDYRLDTPVRAAERGAKESKFGLEALLNRGRQAPNMVSGTLAGELGVSQQNEARGREALGTVDARIDSTNADARMKQLLDRVTKVRMAGAANPAMGQAEYLDLLKGVPQELRSAFPPAYSHEAMDNLMNVLSDSIEQRGKVQLQRMGDASREQIAMGHDLTNRDIARINADARLGAASLKNSDKIKLENFLSRLTQQVSEGKPLTPDQERAAQWAQQMLYGMRSGSGLDPAAMQLLLMQQLGILPSGTQVPGRVAPSPTLPPRPGQPAGQPDPNNPLQLDIR